MGFFNYIGRDRQLAVVLCSAGDLDLELRALVQLRALTFNKSLPPAPPESCKAQSGEGEAEAAGLRNCARCGGYCNTPSAVQPRDQGSVHRSPRGGIFADG